ncbi:MAG: hypothetical protein K8H86_05170, partial [Ignavibacteriaceae bacterium]|nr:hypothetical protein [Ignavibacteriaceae bacterium]
MILIVGNTPFFAQSIESKISSLEQLPKNSILDSTESIIIRYVLPLPHNEAVKKINQLIIVTERIDIESYLKVLSYSVDYSESGKIDKLNNIYD